MSCFFCCCYRLVDSCNVCMYACAYSSGGTGARVACGGHLAVGCSLHYHRCCSWCDACHTLHLTPHTSHLTPHTLHLTPHTSHLTPCVFSTTLPTQAPPPSSFTPHRLPPPKYSCNPISRHPSRTRHCHCGSDLLSGTFHFTQAPFPPPPPPSPLSSYTHIYTYAHIDAQTHAVTSHLMYSFTV